MFKLAWRNLWRRKRRTAITVVSIAVGVGLCLFFTGISDGMYGQIIAMAVRSGSGHLVVENPAYRDDQVAKNSLHVGDDLLGVIRSVRNLEGYSLRVSGPGMISTSHGTVGGGFDAVNPDLDRKFSLLARSMVEGRYLESGRDMIVGVELARKLKAKIGSKIVLTTQDKDGETVQELFRLVGTFHTRSDMLDGFYFQIILAKAQTMIGLAPNEVTQLGIYLENRLDMPDATRLLAATAVIGAEDQVIVPWQEILSDLASYIEVDSASNYIFLALLFLVILAGVLNTVLMSVMERTYEFGVMLSIGMSRSRLMGVVLVECAMLGVIGTLSGGVLGWLVDRLLNRYPIDLSRYIEDTSIGGFFMDMSLRSNILLNHFIIIITLVFLTILIVGIYPAWKAGRIEPVDALHSL